MTHSPATPKKSLDKPTAQIASWTGFRSMIAISAGSAAFGAIAVGALAIGALRVGKLSIGQAKIDRLEIGELILLNDLGPGAETVGAATPRT